jgi:hypothetical protein
MSYWPGGTFYGLRSNLGPAYVERGRYEFDETGRLDDAPFRKNPIPLAARINPYTRTSHNSGVPNAPLASLQTIPYAEPSRAQNIASGSGSSSGSTLSIRRSLLDNWHAGLSAMEDLFDTMLNSIDRNNIQEFRRNRDQMRTSLENLKRAIRNRTMVDLSPDRGDLGIQRSDHVLQKSLIYLWLLDPEIALVVLCLYPALLGCSCSFKAGRHGPVGV